MRSRMGPAAQHVSFRIRKLEQLCHVTLWRRKQRQQKSMRLFGALAEDMLCLLLNSLCIRGADWVGLLTIWIAGPAFLSLNALRWDSGTSNSNRPLESLVRLNCALPVFKRYAPLVLLKSWYCYEFGGMTANGGHLGGPFGPLRFSG